MELGNGLIGHLLSRPNPTLSPFAPLIRRRRPANNTSPLLSSPFFFFFLLSLPRSTRDACTRRGGRRTTVDARTQSFPSSSTTCQVDENDDGPADARPGEALEFSTGDCRVNRFCSYRVGENGCPGGSQPSFSGCIIEKLFERSFEEQFFFRFFSSLVCFLLFSYLDRSRVETKLQTRNTIGR